MSDMQFLIMSIALSNVIESFIAKCKQQGLDPKKEIDKVYKRLEE